MDFPIVADETTLDLSKYTIKDSCLWLLNRLEVDNYNNNSYTLPFCSYVLSWYKCIPLKCIILAQNPYPNNIYSPIASAMSYSEDLCRLEMKKMRLSVPVPPTVQILANDLYINAGLKKEDSINIFKNGWKLIEEGILLVNEGVFRSSNDPKQYKESTNQCNVIIRLLRETEQYGKRTVDVYGLGEAGQRMASNLCSWYKSTTIKLSKHAVTHPAALSRRFTNFNDPSCHMGVPSFSKSLAKHLSNHVALLYSMAKKSDIDLRIQRYADIINSSAEQFKLQQEAQQNFNKIVKELVDMDKGNSEEFNRVMAKLLESGETLAFRTGVCSSVMSNIQRVSDSVSGHISKPGPSLVTPSISSLSYHVGQGDKPAKQISMKPIKLNISKRSDNQQNHEDSSFSQISAPSSVKSVDSTSIAPTKLKLTKINLSANSTPATSGRKEIISDSSTKSTTTESVETPTRLNERPTMSSMGARFRKMDIATSSGKPETSGKKDKNKIVENKYKISVEQRNQLSSVEAVVQTHKEDVLDDKESTDIFELIQHDISHMTKYNECVKSLIDAIDKDIASIPKFDFASWAIDDSKPSATFDLCKEMFGF